MNWLAKFSPKGTSPTALPEVTKPQASFDGVIRHAQWKRPGGGTIWTEDAFVNPDPASPIAAILISRSDGNMASLGIDLVSRESRYNDTVAALQNNELSFGGMAFGISGETVKGLQSLELHVPRYTNTVLAHDGSITEKREVITNRARKVMETMQQSSLLSDNPAIRDALMDAMRAQLVSLRSLDKSTPSIEGR